NAIGPAGTVIQGKIQDTVVRSNLTHRLHFYHRIFLASTSNASVVSVGRASFAPAGWPTDVDWRNDQPGNVNPWLPDRSANGALVTFRHGGGLAARLRQTSRSTFVVTRASEFNEKGTFLIRWQRSAPFAPLTGTIGVLAFAPIQ